MGLSDCAYHQTINKNLKKLLAKPGFVNLCALSINVLYGGVHTPHRAKS